MRSGLIVLGAMLVAACSAGLTGESPPQSTTPAPPTAVTTTVPAAASTTPTPPSTTSTTLAAVGWLDLTHPDAPPPEVDLRADTFDELIRVWGEIDRYLVWLYAHPTLDDRLLDRVLEPGSTARNQVLDSMRTLVDNSYRSVREATLGEVTAFSCCPDPQSEMAAGSISVAIQSRSGSPAVLLLGARGETVAEMPGWELKEWRLKFNRGEEGTWRVASFGS